MLYKKLCEWCGKNFTAKKSTTRFCSRRCASHSYKQRIRKETHDLVRRQLGIKREYLTEKGAPEVMTPAIAAMYLGVHRATIYRYMEQGILKAKQLPGKTLLIKSDLRKLFEESGGYVKRIRSPADELTDFITVKEAAEILDLSIPGAYKVLKENNVPLATSRGKHYYSSKHIRKIAETRKAASHPEITEWYTTEDISKKYGMTESAVHCFVYDYNIPKKRAGKIAMYSKVHVDMAKESNVDTEPECYTVEECMKKYSFTRDQVYHYLRYYKIPRIQFGKYVKFRKYDFDKIFNIEQHQ